MSDKISELEKEIEFQINILKEQLLKNVNNEKSMWLNCRKIYSSLNGWIENLRFLLEDKNIRSAISKNLR